MPVLPTWVGICGGLNSVGIDELADDFDAGTLAGAGGHAGGAHQVHTFLLAEGPDDHLELRDP